MGSFLPDSPSKLQSERSFEQMARKGENIYKRKDGRWEGRYIRERTPEGQAVYGYVYGRSYREVKEKKMEAIIAPEDEYPGKDKVEYLFQDAAEKWLYDILPQVKESTGNKYQNLIETYIYPDYRDTPLIAITQRSLEEYQRRLLRAGGVRGEGLSPKTVTDILSVLGRILTLGGGGKDIRSAATFPPSGQGSRQGIFGFSAAVNRRNCADISMRTWTDGIWEFCCVSLPVCASGRSAPCAGATSRFRTRPFMYTRPCRECRTGPTMRRERRK